MAIQTDLLPRESLKKAAPQHPSIAQVERHGG